MPIPNLDDQTDRLDATVETYLAGPIQYSLSGSSFEPKMAHVDYRDQMREVGGAKAIAQDIQVSLRVSEIQTKPVGTHRVTLPKRPGKTYRPVNVGFDESGTHYEFELQEVVDA